jgi:ech hydrogenase subunit D
MDVTELIPRVTAYRDGGWRLVVINATAVLPSDDVPSGAFDVTWSFELDGVLEHLASRVEIAERVPSISSLFPPAFLYENELRELFGIDVTDVVPDFKGQLYRTAERVPFSPQAIRARLAAGAALARAPREVK